jgi:putative aldouronate transport system permease protein
MLVDDKRLYPLQYLLLKLRELQTLAELQMAGMGSDFTVPGESLKMATAIVTIGPIVFFYPFLQRFVKGLIIGSIKG